jgi:hypothetical protein
MAGGTGSDKTPDGLPIRLGQLAAAMSGLTMGEIEDVLQGPLTSGTPLAGLLTQQPPSRRLPRRGEVVTYRVRVDLNGTRPPLTSARIGAITRRHVHGVATDRRGGGDRAC